MPSHQQCAPSRCHRRKHSPSYCVGIISIQGTVTQMKSRNTTGKLQTRRKKSPHEGGEPFPLSEREECECRNPPHSSTTHELLPPIAFSPVSDAKMPSDSTQSQELHVRLQTISESYGDMLKSKFFSFSSTPLLLGGIKNFQSADPS